MEQQTLKRTLETTTNIAVLLVALAALSTLAIVVFLKPTPPSLRAGLEKGKAFGKISTVDYDISEQTLLIALNTNCSYCQQSLPLYRKLSDTQHQGRNSLRIIALFPNKAEEVAKYMKENGLVFETVCEVDFASFRVSATPTMILVNSRGEVKDFWVGRLTAPAEEIVVHSLTTQK